MPRYVYECECGLSSEHVMSVAAHVLFGDITVCECGGIAYQSFKNIQVCTFKPFSTDAITGQEVEVVSKSHRDALLTKHNLTMDENRYHRKPKVKYAVDDVDFGQVKAIAERGTLDDGTPIQGTVDESIPDD